MDGQGWRRFSGVAFLVVVLLVGVSQVLVFRLESTAVGLKTLTESLVFLAVAAALVIVPFSEQLSSVDAEAAESVYPPVLLGLGLLAVQSMSDLLDEFLAQSELFSSAFEDLTLFLGIAALVVGVLRWNDHHERQARLLQRQRDRLEDQNDRLERFASVVSHDLRNPLEVARGRLRYARETGEDEHFEEAATALDRMEAIVTEVLALVGAGANSVDKEPVTLGSVVGDARTTVDTDGVSLDVRVEDGVTVDADEALLRQLFENLLRNSVEHGSTGDRSSERPDDAPDPGTSGDANDHPGDPVTVRIGVTEDGFYFEDDGPGIDPADREEVFEAGYTTSPTGTGLGLNIVAEIASAHGWTVSVGESDEGGVRFEVTGVSTDAAAEHRSPAV